MVFVVDLMWVVRENLVKGFFLIIVSMELFLIDMGRVNLEGG